MRLIYFFNELDIRVCILLHVESFAELKRFFVSLADDGVLLLGELLVILLDCSLLVWSLLLKVFELVFSNVKILTFIFSLLC